MDRDILFTALDKYFKTLSMVGYINSKETKKLFVLMFLKEYIDNLTELDDRVYEVFDCLYKGSCTINKRLGCVTITHHGETPEEYFTYTFNFNLA